MTIQAKFEEGTLQQALARGYDTVQIKYPGWLVNLYAANEKLKVYATNPDRDLMKTYDIKPGLLYQLVGTQYHDKIVVHDCLGADFEGEYYRLNDATYRDRYAITRSAVKGLNLHDISLAPNFPISFAEQLWPRVINEDAKGLIFRKSTDKPYGVILLQRCYPDLVQHFNKP